MILHFTNIIILNVTWNIDAAHEKLDSMFPVYMAIKLPLLSSQGLWDSLSHIESATPNSMFIYCMPIEWEFASVHLIFRQSKAGTIPLLPLKLDSDISGNECF